MVQLPNPRLSYLFATLLSEPLPQDEIAKRLAISTRTVRADISALNTILSEYGAQFVLRRGKGYHLKIEDATRFSSFQNNNGHRHTVVPRNSQERVDQLLLRFLTSAFSLKLEELADEFFVSRGTLQNDMAEVRDYLNTYQLSIEAKPYYGMKLFGHETAIRSCLTDLLLRLYQTAPCSPLLNNMLHQQLIERFSILLHELLAQYMIRLTDEGEQYIVFYCIVALYRIKEGYPLPDFELEETDAEVHNVANALVAELHKRAKKEISIAEGAYLQVNIAARRVQEVHPTEINADDGETLVNYILSYISKHYNYHLKEDKQLHADLLTHIKSMITRVKYRINIANPLLINIKQHYPLAYEMTLAAVCSWSKYTPYTLSENEIGYLVLHIGVGLERHYHISYERHPQALLVCDTGNSTVRMIQAQIARHFPQVVTKHIVSIRDYEVMSHVDEDFVISNIRVSEKDKPVVIMSPFPSNYQLEQLGKLVLIDRTRPYMLEKFFDAEHFMIINEPISQEQLFRTICSQLEQEDIISEDFYPSVVERESIVSTMLGDGIALPHALGLLAKKTMVVTVLAPSGIPWGEREKAYLIFLLAISKQDYEEAIAIYELFVTFVRDRSMNKLLASENFTHFKSIALECLKQT